MVPQLVLRGPPSPGHRPPSPPGEGKLLFRTPRSALPLSPFLPCSLSHFPPPQPGQARRTVLLRLASAPRCNGEQRIGRHGNLRSALTLDPSPPGEGNEQDRFS